MINRMAFFSFIFLWAPMAMAQDLKDGTEILKRSEEVRRLPSVQASGVLKTQGPGLSDQKSFQFFRKLAEDGERFKTLTRFQKPATIRDQAILFLEKENYESSVFMYLPTFKKVRRVESHSQSSAFMGSAFSYSDISTPQAKDYNSKLLKTENCPAPAKGTCYVIESKPRTADVKERTNYDRLIIWVQTQQLTPVQWDLFEKVDQPIRKRMKASAWTEVAKGKWFSKRLEIEDFPTKKKTVLEFLKINAKEELSDSIFTQASLGR